MLQIETPKRKHGELSSTSDLETSVSSPTTTSTPVPEEKTKSQKKREAKKAKKAKTEEIQKQEEKREENEESDKMAKTLQEEIREINTKLSQMITKDDDSFMKQLIQDAIKDNKFVTQLVKDVVMEMKNTLLESVNLRLDKVEGDVHEVAVKNKELQDEVDKLKTAINEKNELIEKLNREKVAENLKNAEIQNEQEQYSRRNNVRILGLDDKTEKEHSIETRAKVVRLLKTQCELDILPEEIEIAHRLGSYEAGKSRPIIARFVRRQTKIDVMAKKSKFKDSGMFMGEDLTKLNNEVLASTRKKQPDRVKQSWSVDGKIFVKWKSDESVQKLKFEEYQKWLDLPWP